MTSCVFVVPVCRACIPPHEIAALTPDRTCHKPTKQASHTPCQIRASPIPALAAHTHNPLGIAGNPHLPRHPRISTRGEEGSKTITTTQPPSPDLVAHHEYERRRPRGAATRNPQHHQRPRTLQSRSRGRPRGVPYPTMRGEVLRLQRQPSAAQIVSRFRLAPLILLALRNGDKISLL